jgi:hypothetical protein
MESPRTLLLARHGGTKVFVADLAPAGPQDAKIFGEEAVALKVVDRGDQEAFGEISGSSEDDHDARLAHCVSRKATSNGTE